MKPIKTHNLVLGVIVAIIIACTTLYFITVNTGPVSTNKIVQTINKFEKEVTNMEIKEEAEFVEIESASSDRIQTSQAVIDQNFMDINIQASNLDAEHPIIESAFGFKVGEVFDKKKAIAELTLSSGDTIYEVQPEQPYMGIGKYYITTDETNNTIDSVRGKGTFSSLRDAENELNKLENVIEQKYNEVYLQNEFRYYKDERGNILLLFLKPRDNGAYDLHLHCLKNN